MSNVCRTLPKFAIYFSFLNAPGAALGPSAGDQLAPIPIFYAGSPQGYDFRRPLGLGIQGKHNISPKLTIPTSSCIHPSAHNQETFGICVPQPSKSIRHTSYGNTTELPPRYWVASRLSHQQLHTRDFLCR